MRVSSIFSVRLFLWVVLALLLVIVSANRDFYKILDLPKNANEKQIKKAYRKLSMRWHPDKNQGSKEAEAMFQDVAAAYEVLSDKEKRRMYDQGGEEALKRQQQGGGGGGFGADPFDIFSNIFGHGNRHRQREQARGPDVIIPVDVTLEDIYNGKSFEIQSKQRVLCNHCRGSGADDDTHVHTCPHCKGQGVVMKIHQVGPGFIQQTQSQCHHCQGKGKTIAKKCHVCHGARVEAGERILDVVVEPGMNHGDKVEYDNGGDESPDHVAGHVIFEINVLKHIMYERQGNDLKTVIEISLKESLLGFERWLTHMDGRKIRVQRTSVTKPGAIIKVANEGMPIRHSGGDKGVLNVHIVVIFPKLLTTDQQNLFKTLF